MTKPLLTCIVFTYNHKNLISRCIESLLNQKTSYKYEIRIYDDCSIDGTSNICREYARKYPDKIRLKIQKENTFTKPDLQLQSYQAISEIDTKYFCVIDGDDYWCNENKIQMALDFLENHPEYEGWAHDTLINNEFAKTKTSYLHEDCGFGEIKNPVKFSATAPFFYISSRIFRTAGYSKLKTLPIDYLEYWYHFSKGPIYCHDEIMAVYTIGANNTYCTQSTRFIIDNAAMMTYRLSKLFKFKQDKFCTELLLEYETRHDVKWKKNRYGNLLKLKKIFGVKLGWHIWFLYYFAYKYGFEAGNVNFVYNRKKAKKASDIKVKISNMIENDEFDIKKMEKSKEVKNLEKRIAGKIVTYKLLSTVIFNYGKYLPKNIIDKIKKDLKRKKDKIIDLNQSRNAILKVEYDRYRYELCLNGKNEG